MHTAREIDPGFQGAGTTADAAMRASATEQSIEALNPLLRDWGVRRLFHQLDRWIVRRALPRGSLP
jgi:hypothetical protein